MILTGVTCQKRRLVFHCHCCLQGSALALEGPHSSNPAAPGQQSEADGVKMSRAHKTGMKYTSHVLHGLSVLNEMNNGLDNATHFAALNIAPHPRDSQVTRRSPADLMHEVPLFACKYAAIQSSH